MATTNPSSAFSYTNKDFVSIYTELLDLAKKLSSKWDPSISNESDPGVVLLKLNAIIADKNNYNIDKNILEFYPETAAQPVNIRNIYHQLGYNMPWYRSGEGTVAMQWQGDMSSTGLTVTIPKFTQISNADKTVVYTITDDVYLPLSKEIINVPIMGGQAAVFSVAGNSVITTASLDNRNRLYFSDTTVAENGIFINSYRGGVLQNDYTSWRKVNNILLEDVGTPCYEFGIDANYGLPYIEFPDDIDELIPEGMRIVYLISNGVSDNINAWALDTIFNDNLTITDSEGTTYDFTSEYVTFYNSEAIVGNEDPETLAESKENYKRTLGTFDTLVTLRDYINALYNSGLVANGVVTDRKTDLQNSYHVAINNGVEQKVVAYSNDMDAFDLKLYLLQYVGTPNNFGLFNLGFTMVSSVEPNSAVTSYLEEQKCISHDFVNLQLNKICILKNKYQIGCKIIPTSTLNDDQKTSLIDSIKSTIFNNLNSHEIGFGEQVSFQSLFDLLSKSNPLIRTISLDNINFYTYASYFDSNEKYKEVCVSNQHPYKEGYFANGVFYPDSAHKLPPIVGDQTLQYLDLDTGNVYNFVNGSYVLYSNMRNEFRDTIKLQCVLSGCTNLFDLQENFNYTLFHKFIASHRAQTVDTNTTIEISNVSGSALSDTYDLKENEMVQFYAPALNTTTEYSTYVKYVYYSPITDAYIPADTNYTLTGDEWITFFWKNTESDLRYSYHKYGAGTIVYSVSDIYQDSTAYPWASGLSTNTQGKVVTSSINNNLAQYTTGVLGSGQTVSIKEKSDTVLSSVSNQVYFITRDTTAINGTNNYTMFHSPEVLSKTASWADNVNITVDTEKLFLSTGQDTGNLIFTYLGENNVWVYGTAENNSGAISLDDYGVSYNGTIIYTVGKTSDRVSFDGTTTLTKLTSANGSVHLVFTYNSNKWQLNSSDVELSNYGITVSGTWSNGNTITLSLINNEAVLTVSGTGTAVITNPVIARQYIYQKNRRYTFRYASGTQLWTFVNNANTYTTSALQSSFGIIYSTTGGIADGTTFDVYVQNESISINMDKKLTESYLLKSGEYFLYKSGTILKLFGSGTRITRRAIWYNNAYMYPTPWTCPVIPAENILEYGLSAINSSSWFVFYRNNFQVNINEMEFINVLEGGTIGIASSQTDTSVTLSSVTIDSSGSHVFSADVSGYENSSIASAPYSVDYTTASGAIQEDGVYQFIPALSESDCSTSYGVSNTGLVSTRVLTYNGTSWHTPVNGVSVEVTPANMGLRLTGTWVNNDKITIRWINNSATATATSSGGTVEITNHETLAPFVHAVVTDYIQPFKKLGAVGSFEFTWNGSGWVVGGTNVGASLQDYGIVYEFAPANGDTIVVVLARTSDTKLFAMTSDNWSHRDVVSGTTYGISNIHENAYALITITRSNKFNSVHLWYQNTDDSDRIYLPIATVSEDGYEAYSILNLNCGIHTPQSIYPNQTITLRDGDTEIILDASANIMETEGRITYLVADMVVTENGGDNIDVSRYAEDGETLLYPTFSNYYLSENPYSGLVTVNGYTTTMKIPAATIVGTSTIPTTTTYGITFSYPVGNYILPLYNPNDLDTLSILYDYEPSLDGDNATIKNPDALFLKLIDTPIYDSTGRHQIVFALLKTGYWQVGSDQGNVVSPQDLVSQYGIEPMENLEIGDKITAVLPSTGSIDYSCTDAGLTVSIDPWTFKEKVNLIYGKYDFIYRGSAWTLNGVEVALNGGSASDYGYGISVEGNPTEGATISVLYVPEYLSSIYDRSLTNFNEDGYYYIYLPYSEPLSSPSVNAHTIRIFAINSDASTYSIRVDKPCRIISPDSYAEIDESVQQVAQFIASSGYTLDCTRQVDASIVISDPLDANAFMNVNHAYNKFTICQATGAEIQLI